MRFEFVAFTISNPLDEHTWLTPFPNMEAGLVGYDPVFADPVDFKKDPGLKHQMLEPTLQSDDGTNRLIIPEYIDVEDDLRCTTSATMKRFQNFKDYDEHTKSAIQFAESKEEKSSTGIFFWKSTQSESTKSSRNSRSNTMKKFFKDTNGEVYVTEATCQVYTMSVKEDFPLVFTGAFTNKLKSLHYASKLPKNDATGNTIFKRFVEEYGSFFVSKVSMGAKFWIESRFSQKKESQSEVNSRMKCVSDSISKGKSSSLKTPELKITAGVTGEVGEGVKVGGAVSTEFTIPSAIDLSSSSGSGDSSSDCSSSGDASKYFDSNGMKQTETFSIGSRPTTLDTWTESIFIPVPISYTIKPMTSLINPIWHQWIEGGNLGKIPVVESTPDGEKLDPEKIEEFFAQKLKEYCQIVLNSAECPVYETKGCGLNSFCSENENGIVTTCENDDNSEVGYKCVVKPVDCELSQWGDCNGTCGEGVNKSRNIIIPSKHGGKECSEERTKSCNFKPCPERKVLLVTGYPFDAGKQVEGLNKDGQPKLCPSIQNYPLGLNGAMGGMLKDKVVICGGSTSTSSSGATNECYQLGENGQWATFGAGLNSARYWGTAAPVTIQGEEYLWITGGRDASGNFLATTELLSSSGNVKAGPNLPETRSVHGMLVINKKVMVIGGYNANGNTNSVLIYNTDDLTRHEKGPSMIHKRRRFACSTMVSPAHNGRMIAVVAGGWDENDKLDKAEILDFTMPGSVWELTAKLPKAMGGPRMSPTPDGKFVILTYEKQIYRLNCQKGRQCTWVKLPYELQISRQYHIQLTVPNKVLNNC